MYRGRPPTPLRHARNHVGVRFRPVRNSGPVVRWKRAAELLRWCRGVVGPVQTPLAWLSGHTTATARPTINDFGIGPKNRLSSESVRLSPMT